MSITESIEGKKRIQESPLEFLEDESNSVGELFEWFTRTTSHKTTIICLKKFDQDNELSKNDYTAAKWRGLLTDR